MGKLKKYRLTLEDFQYQLEALETSDKVWYAEGGRVLLIEDMDFQHLENIVNFFSREGTTVDPSRQGAFENVMIRYLRMQAEINDVHKDIL